MERATVVQPAERCAHQRSDGGSTPARSLLFAMNMQAEAEMLVRKFHYSQRPPASVQAVGSWHLPDGLLGLPGTIVAACFFSIPPTRWTEEVIELSRLVRCPSQPASLTQLVKLTVKRLPQQFDLAVSFADRTQGHVGYVYQAGNWRYGGARERAMDGVIIAGKFHPGRSCNSQWGTRSPAKLTELLRMPVEPHYDEGKHLYWMPVSRTGQAKAERMGLKSLPYPKAEAAK